MHYQYSHAPRVIQEPAGDQYSTRAQGKRTGKKPRGTYDKVLESAAYCCQYCGYPASTVDHIVPWSYGGTDRLDNLAAACSLCNSLATNMVFDTFEEKRRYVLGRLALPKYRHRRLLNICCSCKDTYRAKSKRSTSLYCSRCMIENGW